MQADPLAGFTLEPANYVTWVDRLRERFPSVPIGGLIERVDSPSRLVLGVVATYRTLAG